MIMLGEMSAGGSDRYKNDWPAVEAAVRYVADQAGRLAEVVDGKAMRCVASEDGGDKRRRS